MLDCPHNIVGISLLNPRIIVVSTLPIGPVGWVKKLIILTNSALGMEKKERTNSDNC